MEKIQLPEVVFPLRHSPARQIHVVRRNAGKTLLSLGIIAYGQNRLGDPIRMGGVNQPPKLLLSIPLLPFLRESFGVPQQLPQRAVAMEA
jgi:hypothetical protein